MSIQEDAVVTILVVDDDPAIRRLLGLHLQHAGYNVAGAVDGIEALEYLRSSPGTALILLDLWMPRMNGWIFRLEQKRDPALANVPVLVLSGVEDPAPPAAFLDAAGYLKKPVAPADLVAAVRRILE